MNVPRARVLFNDPSPFGYPRLDARFPHVTQRKGAVSWVSLSGVKAGSLQERDVDVGCEYRPMLSGQLVGRLFSMAGRVCLTRGRAGLGTVGPVEAAIRTKLEQALNPEVLELRNESRGHAVPPGSETHFRVAVVSSRFEGLSPLQRHRLVHAALSEELAGPVHALAIQARTPAQWRENPQLDTSPPCMGGSKKTRGTP
ncbi:bolA-like protein 1 [Equus quagga]|uniref:bolA-like protein 1 n=1 Tax=Equus quagga TaxID=89248 RepID=UPI001EE18DBF|nr:bolA-like protein 1 [Equus quagga]